MISRRRLLEGRLVVQRLVDWSRPWIVYAEHRRWISGVTAHDQRWTASLEGRGEMLKRSCGGRFGGRWTTVCPYTLGSTFTDPGSGMVGGCKVSLPYDGVKRQGGFRVESVTSRVKFRITAASIPVLSDDWLRHGSIAWYWQAPTVTGTVTATTTSTTLQDNTKNWATDEHRYFGGRILLSAGGAANGAAWCSITSNTSNTLTFVANPEMAGFTAGTHYDICPGYPVSGAQSHVIGYNASTREVEILVPMPIDIQPGHSGVWTVGCDGLLSTCRDKFANQLNFGGDPFAPASTAIVEPIGER
jgi:hypothetical protein